MKTQNAVFLYRKGYQTCINIAFVLLVVYFKSFKVKEVISHKAIFIAINDSALFGSCLTQGIDNRDEGVNQLSRRSSKKGISIFVMFCIVWGLFTGVHRPVVYAAGTPIIVSNGSFESDLASWNTSFTPAEGTTPITIQGSWIPIGGGTKRLDYWSASAYTANTHQTITGLKNGSYTLSAWVERGAGFNESYMYAKDTGLAEVKANVPESSTWVQISMPLVVANNQLTLGFYADGNANNFMGVDLITLVLDEAAPARALENTSFEQDLTGWETSFGPEGSETPISIKDWTPENGGMKRLNYWSANAYTADTFQTATGLENGTYTLSAWVARGDGFTQSYMYAKNTGRAEVKVNIPVSSSSWTKISLPVVIENNQVTIGFYADGAADKWLGVDLISLVKEEEAQLEPVGVAIGNQGFEAEEPAQVISSWSEEGDMDASYTEAPGYLSSYGLTHYSDHDYKVTTSQTITGLENGYYTLTAWAQNGGGQHASYIFARDHGTSEARAAVPIGSTWTKVYLRGIQVTNGTATIGLFSDAQAGNWTKLDFVELVKDDQPYKFLKGGDVSELTYVESQGGKFYDSKGNEKDLFQLLKENGHDIVRLRVYNEPGKGHGDGSYYRPAGIMDKADILKLAKRAKAAGLQIQLSFHYSDYWTNGATHNIPNAWQTAIKDLADDAAKVTKLEELLRAYTLDVMEAMVDQGTTPEFVSLGNEMQSGILFPYGRASGGSWANLARFLKAGAEEVKKASPTSKVILHLDDAGNTSKYENFFDEIEAREVPYDIIGPSYYPFWTDDTIEQIVAFCNYFSKKYDKDIMIMETGYNWNPTLPNGTIGQLNDNGPYPADTSSPQGQKEFMINLFNGLKSVDNGRVIGDLYWDPIMIAVPGVGWAIKEIDDQPDLNVVSNTTLFDFDGKALPAHDAYKLNTEGSTLGHISGVVRGALGKGIAHATIAVDVNGTMLTTKSDAAGNYFIPDLPIGKAYAITAAKSGYEGGNISVNLLEAGTFTSNQNIAMIGGAITGTVKDQNHNAVIDAKVSTIIDGVVYSEVTDSTGQYTLADLPAATNVTVTVAKEGYVSEGAAHASVAIGSTTSSIDLSLALNSGTITGTIIGSDKAPIDKAQVSVAAAGKVYSALTNAAGEYRLVNIPAGINYKVIAIKSGYLNAESSPVSVKVGETTSDVHLTLLNNLGAITGIVLDSSYSPVEDATVIAVKGEKTYTAKTNAAGQYVLADVLGGNAYSVSASKEGYLNGSASAVDVATRQTTKAGNIILAAKIPLINAGFEQQGADKYTLPGWNITGTANATFASKDNPKDGSYVLNLWHAGAYESDANQTITGLANGYYTVSAWFYNGGEQKEYYMYAKDSNGELARLNIPKTNAMTPFSMVVKVERGELTLGFYANANAGNWALVDAVAVGFLGEGTGAISGEVKDAAGNKLADAAVKTVIEGVEYAAVSSAAGEFTLSDIPQGSGYSIAVSKAGYITSSVTEVAVTDKQVTSGVTIVLAAEAGPSPTPTTPVDPEPTPTTPVEPTPTPATPVTPQPTPTVQAVNVDLRQGLKNDKDHSITVTTMPTTGTLGIIANMAAKQMTELANEGLQAVIFKTGFATISFAPDLFKDVINPASKNVQFSAAKVDASALSNEVKKTVGDNTVYDFNLTVDGVKVPHFDKNKVIIELPYTLRQGEEPHNVVIFYINEDGKLEIVKNAIYDAAKATVTFSPSHFSKYAAVYKAVSFTDLAKAGWAQQSIEFLAARGIISGFEDQTFKPTDAVTRGQFLHMLMGILDTAAKGDGPGFSDVKEGAWYAEAIINAQKLGIVKGKDDGSFGVHDIISREEMAVMMYRAVKAVNVKLSNLTNVEAFADQAQIADYAVEAIQQMQQAGLVNGVGQGVFAPKGHATRAQAAVILERLFQMMYSAH